MTATANNKSYLFLYREKGESVVIGEGDLEVVLTVESIRDNKVKLSFRADKSARIDRMERLQQEEH
jgi:sRNA-binding carbon storage regulator CsrA